MVEDVEALSEDTLADLLSLVFAILRGGLWSACDNKVIYSLGLVSLPSYYWDILFKRDAMLMYS